MPEYCSKLKCFISAVDKIAMHDQEIAKHAHNTRSAKVKENILNKHELMFNQDLQIVIQKENLEKVGKERLRSSESYKSSRNKTLKSRQAPVKARTEKARTKKVKTNRMVSKLEGNIEKNQKDCLTTDGQQENFSDNIDKVQQKCIVKLIRLKTEQNENNGVLKDLNTSNSSKKSNENGITGDTCKANKKDNNDSSDSFEKCTIVRDNTATIEKTTSKFDELEASIVRYNGDDYGDITRSNFTEASALINSGIHSSTPLRNSVPTTPIIKCLRNNDRKNYRESSLSLTENKIELPLEDNMQKKVPVYQRIIQDVNKPKVDLYEFDDIDLDTKYKMKKRNNSGKFDKTMHSILEKLEKKEKKHQNTMKKHKKATTKVYEKKVNAAVEKVMDKINAKRDPVLQFKVAQHNEDFLRKTNLNQLKIHNLQAFGGNSKNQNGQLKIQKAAISTNNRNGFTGLDKNKKKLQLNGHNKFGDDNHAANKIIHTKGVNNRKIIDSKNITNINQNYGDTTDIDHDKTDENCFVLCPEPIDVNNPTLSGLVVNNSTSIHPLHNNTTHTSSDFYGFSNAKSMLILDRSDNTSINGFNIEEQNRTMQNSLIINDPCSTLGRKDTSINILGNVLIRHAHRNVAKKLTPCEYFVNLHDNYILDNNFGFDYDEEADSIMMAHTRKIVRQTVWRFADIVKRNPHFLFIKNNALPCLSQDMIIDYALVEWIEKRAAAKHDQTTKGSPAFIKVAYQKKIFEYVESPLRVDKDVNKVIHSSLYDYEEFQIPFKPRKVFGVLQTEQLISTPKRHVETVLPHPDVSIIEKDKENCNGSYIDNTENTPPEHSLRIRSGTDEVRKYSKNGKDKQHVLKKVVVKRNQQQIINDTDDDSDIVTRDKRQNMNIDKADNQVQLFDEDEPELLEDVSITIPKMNYPRKRRKRLESEGLDMEEDEKPNKKKKDMMTKEEEIEFEKWASKFNAMCEEVDKYELEVD